MTGELSKAIADRLAHPSAIPGRLTSKPWWRQSLAHGALGVALLHVERAAAGLAPWQCVHDWLTHATNAPITAGGDSHLFYGAPALAHVLACAAAQRPGRYERALVSLNRTIASDARLRVDAAHARIDEGRLPALAEFDVIRGLTGIGSYLLRHDPDGKAFRAVLEYLVRLTEPITTPEGETLPGWWTDSGPSGRRSDRFAGGHGNLGVAHGIGGPLSLLALAALQGVTVDGRSAAIDRICTWLDEWRTDDETDPLWPYWVNRSQLRAGHRSVSGAQRLGWCYGVIGLARAQQLAALATDDPGRRGRAEQALVMALAAPAHRRVTTDPSLCHGYAGLAHMAVRAAADAAPDIANQLRAFIPGLLEAVQPADTDPACTAATLMETAERNPGLLEGAGGVALAVLAPGNGAAPVSGWDTCLLIA